MNVPEEQSKHAAQDYERGAFGKIMERLEQHQFAGVSEPVNIRIEHDGSNYFAMIDLPNLTRAGGGTNRQGALDSLARILRQEAAPAAVNGLIQETQDHVLAIAKTPDDPGHPSSPAEAA